MECTKCPLGAAFKSVATEKSHFLISAMLQQQQLLPDLHPAPTYQQLHARILQPKQTRAEVSTARNVLNKLLVQAIDGVFFNL